MSRTVPAEGPPRARIAIVGEAPGQQEESMGRPFVGGAGKMLSAMLDSVGINRRECYVTNVSNERPPRNDFSVFYNDKRGLSPTQTLVKHRERLRKELEAVKPNVIVALGNEPLKALTGHNGITKWRGSIIDTEWGKVVPTLHPAYLLRIYKDRAIVEMDLRRAKEESLSKECRLPRYNLTIDPDFDSTIDYLRGLQVPGSRFSFDVETFRGGRMLIRCLGFATGPREAFVIPFVNSFYTQRQRGERPSTTLIDLGSDCSPKMSNRWTEEEERVIVDELYKVFTSREVESMAQNFPFDSSRILDQFGIPIRNLYMDTMVAHHCCYSEMPKSLDFLCSIYTRCPRYSDYDPGNDRSLWEYNGMDCAVTYEVSEKVQQECESLGVWEFYKRHAEPVMLALTRAQNRGCLIDIEYLEELKRDYGTLFDSDLADLEALAGMPVNPNSPKQVKEFLYEKLKLPPVVSRKTKTVSTDEDALQSLMRKHREHAEVIGKILSCRKSKKLLGGILSSVLTKDHRMLTSYNATGTVTRRLSSSIDISGYGCNMQNVPRGPIRKMFIADPGRKLIKVDLSQAEARGVAWYAKIWTLIDKFSNDPLFDIHTWNAAENIYGVAQEDVTKEMRSVSKPGVHGGNYALGPQTASRLYDIPYQQAKHVLDSYRKALPELEKWWRDVETQLLTTKTLRTPTGGLRVFLDRMDSTAFRSAYAFLPQSLIGDGIINRAFFIADIVLGKHGCYPLIQVHDEIVYSCPEEKLSTVIPIIYNIMEYPVTFEGVEEKMVIPADVSVGDNWFEQTDWRDYQDHLIKEGVLC
jgi:uracil-DNA glycosylase family 4